MICGMSRKQIKCDTVVIGAGSAGLEAFKAARSRGADVIMVDNGPLGTTAQRSGEVPTSLLMSAGLAKHGAARLSSYGIDASGEVRFDTSRVLNQLRSVRSRSTSEVLCFMYSIPEEKRLRGRARFESDHSVTVDDEYLIEFKTAVIATGSTPLVTYEQSRLPDILTTDGFYEQADLPVSAAVFGSSAVGLQLGQALAYLGVDVMVFGQRKLWELTDETVLNTAHMMLASRFPLIVDSFITSIEPLRDRSYAIYYIDQTQCENYLRMKSVIAAAGRVPNVGGLNLQEIGVKITHEGTIKVDPKTMQTSLPHIFAAGDVVHDRQSTTVALSEGRYAGHNAAVYPQVRLQPDVVRLDIVYTDPVLAMVGASFEDMCDRANKTGLTFVTSEARLDDAHYRVRHEEGGVLCMYTDKLSREVMGAEICAAGGDHIAQFLAMAIDRHMTVDDLAAFGFFHLAAERAIAEAAAAAVKKLG